MSLTKRQRELMDLILAGDQGVWFDIDHLGEALGATCSKQALQCSLRILERRGMLSRTYETRRGRRRMVLVPLSGAYSALRAPFAFNGTPTP